MFERVLAAVDHSPSADLVIGQALALTRSRKSEILILHVVDSRKLEGAYLSDLVGYLGLGPLLDVQRQVQQGMEQCGRDLLAGLEERCRGEGIDCEVALSYGFVPDMIAQAAKQADIVVLGQKGEHDHLGRSFFGSTLESAVRRLHLPCLVATEGRIPPESILLAYDGSPHASQALKLAARMVESQATRLSVVSIGKDAEPSVGEACNYLKAHGLTAEALVRSAGKESDAILATASEIGADAIVMGAFGHSHLRDLVLGSTTMQVVEKSTRPVFLCR